MKWKHIDKKNNTRTSWKMHIFKMAVIYTEFIIKLYKYHTSTGTPYNIHFKVTSIFTNGSLSPTSWYQFGISDSSYHCHYHKPRCDHHDGKFWQVRNLWLPFYFIVKNWVVSSMYTCTWLQIKSVKVSVYNMCGEIANCKFQISANTNKLIWIVWLS